VRLTVPRRGGWRAWGAVRADFERALTAPADPAIATAEIASELRRGADYVRVTLALTVLSTDVADALTIAWDAFRSAARDDLAGWEVIAATAEVIPTCWPRWPASSRAPARANRTSRWPGPPPGFAGWPGPTPAPYRPGSRRAAAARRTPDARRSPAAYLLDLCLSNTLSDR
jgi:hypothetical protein